LFVEVQEEFLIIILQVSRYNPFAPKRTQNQTKNISDFHFAKYRQNKHYHLKVLLSGFYSVGESKDFIHRPNIITS